ncbi:hypothetical protein [Brachybacterium sacelli]|uniref:Uncharacterized protein n=1 Tax=Brachybacterium sacelli TaxID=173364 RepID=A0ABS4WZR6_9MICO|nr:hypothetical protein [Brachybacterium sacelli]MBP2381712.1 hypothetical protein [Brachybacterium sacelli]
MTQVGYDGENLRIDFPGWEALMTRRGSIEIPAGAIGAVQVEPGWSSEALGIRSGLVISGYRKVGVFRHLSGTRRLVSMKRGLPLLRIRVNRAVTGVDEVLVSTAEAEQIAGALPSGPVGSDPGPARPDLSR